MQNPPESPVANSLADDLSRDRSSVLRRTAISVLITTLIAMGPFHSASAESTCFGTTQRGSLEGGVPLPCSGKNFSSYSNIAILLRRTYVHSTVREIVVAAYRSLETSLPDRTFVYGETGWPSGGRFRPHKTHQNGLSVDFMVPVLDKTGASVPLTTSVFNKLGYDIEFDDKGRYDDLVIDYEAMSAHIKALHQAASERNAKIGRVIFDPELQPLLFRTKHGSYLRTQLKFSTKRSWVRHDEHYHVDFELDCKRYAG